MNIYIFATFEHSIFLEIAISDLELRGIGKDNILAVPLEQKKQYMQILDTIHRADGVSVLDSSLMFGTLLSVVFSIYGYIWYGGPLLWGLIGLIGGGLAALVVDYALTKRTRNIKGPRFSAEVILVVKCEPQQISLVEQIFQDHGVLGMSKVP